MERVGHFLRKYVPQIQWALERTANVPLGVVDARPYADDCVLDTPEKRRTLALYQFLWPSMMMTKGSTIYYNTSISTLVVPGKTLWNMAAHELGHIAHRKIAGNDVLSSPKDLCESVADYFAELALEPLGRPTLLRVRQGAYRFQCALRENGIVETPEAIHGFLRSEEERNSLRYSARD